MKKHNEVKWAIAIGAIMLTICFLAFSYSRNAENKAKSLDYKIYKLQKNGNDYKDYTYSECRISTDNLITVDKEFNKAFKLDDKSKVTGTKILGEYKIVSGSLFIAFDVSEDQKVIYRSDSANLYEFNSNLYQLVSKLCG